MTDEELVASGEPNHFRAVSQLGLWNVRDPFFVGRNQTYEVIK